jgi:NAD-dependent SIR2 family protein deacetylase
MGYTNDSLPSNAALIADFEGDLGDLGVLARAVEVQGAHLAWLIGAGGSAMSGIPTAGQLIIRFKHELYCEANGLGVQDVDLADPRTRRMIEAYFNANNGFPSMDDNSEYSVAFERAYPMADVRADFVARVCKGASPNYGHFVLAALMATNRLEVVFTTNFDDLIETAAQSVFEEMTPRPTAVIADLGDPEKAVRAFQKSNWPLVAKIHGDFRSDRLKNTTAELQSQDSGMRHVLRTCCGRSGLIVAGFSGRDQSVMDVLRDALSDDASFPSGIFWCYRPADRLADGVLSFLRDAREVGRTAVAVPVDNFVELSAAIERAVQLPAPIRTLLDSKRPTRVITPSPLPTGPTQPYPILRFNALPVLSMPMDLNLLEEKRTVELRDLQVAMREARTRGVVARQSGGRLVTVGDSAQINRALSPLGVTISGQIKVFDWDSDVIDPADHGLALDCITLGLGRTQGLRHVLSRRAHQVRVSDASVASLSKLKLACKSRSGTVPKTSLPWAEALTLNLDRRQGRWWLLLVPEVWVPAGGTPSKDGFTPQTTAERIAVAEFIRERRATRYNRDVNAILDAWVRVLCGGLGPREVRTWNLGSAEGVDPVFEISARTAYSRRFQETKPISLGSAS